MTRRHPIGSRTAQARRLRGDHTSSTASTNMVGAPIDRTWAMAQHLAAVTMPAQDRREGRGGVAYPKRRTDGAESTARDRLPEGKPLQLCRVANLGSSWNSDPS